MTSPFQPKYPLRALSGINEDRDAIFGNHASVNRCNISSLAIPMEFRSMEFRINIDCGLI